MTNNATVRAETERPHLSKASRLGRFAVIGVVLAAVAGTFAYLGGWFTSNELTPARFADGFEEVNGVHHGFRRNHAKGVGVSGFFESNGNGVRTESAPEQDSGAPFTIRLSRWHLPGRTHPNPP